MIVFHNFIIEKYFMIEKKQNNYFCYNYNFFLGISYVMFTPESLVSFYFNEAQVT